MSETNYSPPLTDFQIDQLQKQREYLEGIGSVPRKTIIVLTSDETTGLMVRQPYCGLDD